MQSRLLLVILPLMVACGSTETNTDSLRYPNESSELAVLMRQMFEDAERMRAQMKAGESPQTELQLESILTSEGTEPEKVASEAYKVFADSYLHVAHQFLESPDSMREARFEDMVTACENCHRSLCPGPLVRIKKLRD